MIYPNKVNKNDLIGITATSSGVTSQFDIERLKLAKNNLKKLGYKTIETNNVFTNEKFVSSSGKERAKEFMDLWKNNDVKVIHQVRGGELLLEMIPYIDSNIIKENAPKWLIGYSDSSLLNFYITTKYHIATINSSNILKFAMENLHISLLNQLDVLEKNTIIQKSFDKYEDIKIDDQLTYNLSHKVKYISLYCDKKIEFKGRMIGGCLEAISSLIGTKFDCVKSFLDSYQEGFIWYLDIYDSNPLILERLLWQMKYADWFKNVNGILIGRTRSEKMIGDLTYLDVLKKIFDDLDIPVIIDVDIGHVMPQFSIINGSLGTFIYENNKGILKQEKIN